jgi:hypothetical protein
MTYLILAIVVFSAPSIITVTLKGFGIYLGFIPTAILFGVAFWAAKQFYNIFALEQATKKNLAGHRLSQPDPNQLCFEHNGGYYPYLDFLFSQTINRFKISKNRLDNEIRISLDLKSSDPLIEVEFYAAIIAYVLKESKKSSFEHARMAAKWVVNNKSELDGISNPYTVCEKLIEQDFLK